MKTISIILIVYAFFLAICVALAVHSRIQKKQGFRDKIGQDILFCFLAALFFPVVIYFGCDALYYHNRPRPIPKKMRKWIKKDLVDFKGERMSIAKYNATHKRKFTLEQVYGKKYVASLSPEEVAEFDSFENTLSIDSGLPDDEYTHLATLFAQSFYSEDFSRIKSFLDENVRMISYRKRTLTGKHEFLDYWLGVLSRIKDDCQVSDIKVKMNPFYGHAVVSIKQKDTDEAYVFFHIDSGKIRTAVITPVQQQSSRVRYYDLNRPRLDYEMVISQKGEAIVPEPNRMPCLLCGALSEKLQWYKLEVDSGPFSHVGQVSICPHCKAQAEFYPEVFLRKEMSDSFRLHRSTIPHMVQGNPYIDVFIRFQTELEKAYEMAKAKNGNIDDCLLLDILLAYKTDPSCHLGLKLPETGSFGDVCKLYTFDDEGNTYGIFDKINIEQSKMGAWHAFLLSIAYTLLPTVWHGGYERRTYILSIQDLHALFNGHGIELQQSMIENLLPNVRRGIADDEYVVECCYWNDWKGLVREKVLVEYERNHIDYIEDAGSEVWFQYDCGILF